MLRTIKVCQGLGDFCWIAQKLINANEKFHIVMPDGSPQRGHQLLELMPDLIASHEYVPGLSYKKLNQENIQSRKRKWSQIKEKDFFLSCNQHLECGIRIEQFLPDLQTSYRLNYITTDEDKSKADVFLNDDSKRYIGIYASAYSNARHWNGWDHNQWFKFIRLLYIRNKNLAFVIIGAEYDIDLSQLLMDELKEYNIPFVKVIGESLGTVVEVLKKASYFVGFPSGLSIINETLAKNGIMFYPKHLEKLMNTWADPVRINNGSYKGCLFTEPENIFDWLKNEYQLFKKL